MILLPFYSNRKSAVSPGDFSKMLKNIFKNRRKIPIVRHIFLKPGKEASEMSLKMWFLGPVLYSLLGNVQCNFSASCNLMNIGSMYLSVWYLFSVLDRHMTRLCSPYHIFPKGWKHDKNFPKIKGLGCF